MKVIIDPDACTGHGRCYSLAPTLFDADDEGHGFVTAADVEGDLHAAAETAVANCPERAIRLVEG